MKKLPESNSRATKILETAEKKFNTLYEKLTKGTERTPKEQELWNIVSHYEGGLKRNDETLMYKACAFLYTFFHVPRNFKETRKRLKGIAREFITKKEKIKATSQLLLL